MQNGRGQTGMRFYVCNFGSYVLHWSRTWRTLWTLPPPSLRPPPRRSRRPWWSMFRSVEGLVRQEVVVV